jgi:hypothetical protein
MTEPLPSRPRAGMTVQLVIAVLAVATLAACSSSGSAHSASPAPAASHLLAAPVTHKSDSGALAYANCMRSHGIGDFPSPGSSAPSGMSTSSPRYLAAYKVCKSLRTSGRH